MGLGWENILKFNPRFDRCSGISSPHWIEEEILRTVVCGLAT